MAVTLTITDNQDGTGAVATVAGSNVAATNTLYYARWTGTMGSFTLTSAGSRTGDGTIAVSLTTTYYYVWLLESVLSGTKTNVVAFQNLTDADDESVYYRILQAFKTIIVSLNLSGLTSTHIDEKWLPRSLSSTVDPLPLLHISPAGMEEFPDIMVMTDDVGYYVMVCIIDAADGDYKANQNRTLLWREILGKAFRSQRLSGVPEIYKVIQKQAPVFLPKAFAANRIISILLFQCFDRETRGIGA